MKMKAFSILLTLVCIGFVLMLAGSVAAQNVKFEAETTLVTPRPLKAYEVGDTARFTITVKLEGQAVGGAPLRFSLPDGGATLANASRITNGAGMGSVLITFNRSGTLTIRVSATLPNGNVAVYTHNLRVIGPLTRVVATPVLPKLPDGSPDSFAVGDNFTYTIKIKDVVDLSAWQMDISYNPEVLRVVGVPKEGGFLKSGNAITQFFPGAMSTGKINGVSSSRIGRTVATTGPPPGTIDVLTQMRGVNTVTDEGGVLLTIQFEVLEFAEDLLGLSNVQLSNRNGKRMSYHTVINPVVVTHKHLRVDVNRDGNVNIQDLVVVAGALGGQLGAVPSNPRADVNGDGIVSVLDLIAIHRNSNWGKAVAPVKDRSPNGKIGSAPLSASVGKSAALAPETIQTWIDLAQVEDDGSAIFDLGIANLQQLLQATVPEETKLLLNYPNPFNPETWIPYQLAKATDVTVSIYSVNGTLVRTLALGHQAAGVYQSKSQAAYWDGRNELGERIASGVYFYTLVAGDFSATGKMLVRK